MLRAAGALPPLAGFSGCVAVVVSSVVLFLALSTALSDRRHPADPEHFYETRHLLLFGLPGSFMVLAGKRLAEGSIGDRAAFVGVFGLASIVSVAAFWSSYVVLQARILKQEALSSHLAADADAGRDGVRSG